MTFWKRIVLFFLILLSFEVMSFEVRVATDWQPMSSSQISCLKAATETLWLHKFNEQPDHDDESAWGGKKQGKYKAVIKCLADEDIVFFVVAGTDGTRTREYVNKLMKNFETP
jgi:hypothetical protein